MKEYQDALPDIYDRCLQNYSAAFCTEFQCDAVAVISTLQQHKEMLGTEICLRAMVIVFWAFAVMSSFTKSAKSTSIEHCKTPDAVDFISIEKKHIDFSYHIGRDLDFYERVKLVTEFCEKLAVKENISLFGNNAIERSNYYWYFNFAN